MPRILGAQAIRAAAVRAVLSAACDLEMEVLDATEPRDLRSLSRGVNELVQVLDRVGRVALQRSDELYRRGVQ